MKGFIVSSEGKCLCEVDFVAETNVYRAMLTLRMMTNSTPKQDSKYYVSAEGVLPVTFYGGENSDKESFYKTDLVLAKSNSIEDALWFLENCEEEYEGKRLSDCSVEEVYYSYDYGRDSHGEIYKFKLDNGLVVSIREVYKAIGKLLDCDGLEVTLENIWDLKQLILTMDEFAGMKLSINGRYVEDYIYKIYVHDGAEITRAVDGEKQAGNTKVVIGYYENIYDAIDYVKELTSMISDIEYVEYTYDEDNESIVYTIKTENGFTLDIVEQERWMLIWQ